MDSEGQRSKSSATFSSEEIGNKATPEYFQNVKGGKKNKEKVDKKRTRVTRKTLTIILSAVAALLIVVVVIFVALNIVNSRKHGQRTDEDLPTTITEIEMRAYKEAYKTEGKVDYSNSLYYMNDLIADLVDTKASSDLIFSARAFYTLLMYQAGGKDAALQEALELADSANTETEKFTIYSVLDRLYILNQNWDEAQRYEDLMDTLDVEVNNKGTKSGYGSADDAYANEVTGGDNE